MQHSMFNLLLTAHLLVMRIAVVLAFEQPPWFRYHILHCNHQPSDNHTKHQNQEHTLKWGISIIITHVEFLLEYWGV